MVIGNRYFIEDPESCHLHECSKEYYEDYHKRRDALLAIIGSRINPESKLHAGIVMVSTRPSVEDDNNEDFRKLWMESAENENNPQYKYFKPIYESPNIDKYGHAILPTGLRENTDDATRAARLSFPKTEDEAFGYNATEL